MIPVYTSNFSPVIYGEYDLMVTILSFAAPLLFFQIWDSMLRFSFDLDNSAYKYKIISNSFISMSISLIIYTLSFIALYSYVKFDYPIYIYLYGILLSFQYQYTFISRVFLNNLLFVSSGVTSSVIIVILNLMLIYKFQIGLESLYISSIVGTMIQILIIEYKLRISNKISFSYLDLNLLVKMIKFSIPLCISTLAFWILSGYGRIFISIEFGNYYNGIYAVAWKFGTILTLVGSVFQYAWNELTYSNTTNSQKYQIYSSGINYFLKFIIISLSALMIIIKFVFPFFVDEEYYAALFIVPIILIGVASNLHSNYLGTIFMSEKKTSLVMITTLIAGIFNAIFLIVLREVITFYITLYILSGSLMLLLVLRISILKMIFSIKVNFDLRILVYVCLLIISCLNYYNVISISSFLIIIIIILCCLELFFDLKKKVT